MSIDYYNKNANEYFDRTINHDHTKEYKTFLSLLKPKAKILDLGCGAGRDSKYFINHGYDVTSIDGSVELAKLATQYIGQKVIVKNFYDVKYCNKFDGIWAMSSLLHLSKADTLIVYKNLFKALKKNGILFVDYKVGNGERFSDDGRFYNDYTEQEYREFISKNFNNVKIISLFVKEAILNKNEKFLCIIIKKQ